MKLRIHSQTSTVQLLKFGNGYVTSSYILLGMWLLNHAGLKLSHVSKRAKVTAIMFVFFFFFFFKKESSENAIMFGFFCFFFWRKSQVRVKCFDTIACWVEVVKQYIFSIVLSFWNFVQNTKVTVVLCAKFRHDGVFWTDKFCEILL